MAHFEIEEILNIPKRIVRVRTHYKQNITFVFNYNNNTALIMHRRTTETVSIEDALERLFACEKSDYEITYDVQ